MASKRKFPAKKDASQVCIEVDRLFSSAPMRAYHSAILNYRGATLGRLDPELPESFEAGITMTLPSTRALEVVGALLGKAAGFVRYTDAIAKAERNGVPPQRLVQKADRTGRSLTAMNATLDQGNRVSRAGWGHQLVDGWFVLHLHRRGKPGQGFKWELEAANPLTCAFPEQEGGAFVPQRLARRFTMLLSEAKAMYAMKGTLDRKAPGAFDWSKSLSTPRPIEDGPALVGASQTGQADAPDVEVEVLMYEDGAYVYHVIRNAGSGGGPQANQGSQILYCERNNCYTPVKGDAEQDVSNGAMAVVVPGDTFSFGSDGEKMLPVLFAVQNKVNNLNLLRSIRARSAIKDTPDLVATVDATPEELEQLQAIGALKPVDGEPGGSHIRYVAGKDVTVTQWQLRANQDLDALDVAEAQALEIAVAELLVNTDPSVVATATASAFQTSTGEQAQRHTGWLQNWSNGLSFIDRMITNAVVNDEDEYDLYTTEAQPRYHGTDVEQGERNHLDADDLDFDFDITVVVKQETEDQKNRRMLNALYLRDQRVRTHINVIEEDTVDVTKRVSELLDDALRLVIEPVLIKNYVVPGINVAIKTGAGFDFDLKTEDFMPPAPVGATAPSVGPTQTFAPQPPEPTAGAGEATRGLQ